MQVERAEQLKPRISRESLSWKTWQHYPVKQFNLPHVHQEVESLQLSVMLQAKDCSQVMEHVPHLVVHTSDPQKEFLYLDSVLGSYKVDAANLGCNVKGKSVLSQCPKISEKLNQSNNLLVCTDNNQ